MNQQSSFWESRIVDAMLIVGCLIIGTWLFFVGYHHGIIEGRSQVKEEKGI